ncbi:MAG: hypothetical protein V1750_09260, partial [Acidobacteriota bacterium]
SVATLRNWEQGRRYPHGPACVLLIVAERRPEAVREALAEHRAEVRHITPVASGWDPENAAVKVAEPLPSPLEFQAEVGGTSSAGLHRQGARSKRVGSR